jgi:S-adenosylmethionine decarboxylase
MSGDVFLIIKGVCLDKKVLTDQTLLLDTLVALPRLIGMNALISPIINHAQPDNPGLHGYVAIDTSNITFRSYEKNQRIIANIHSCKDFDINTAISYINDQYKCSSIKALRITESDLI